MAVLEDGTAIVVETTTIKGLTGLWYIGESSAGMHFTHIKKVVYIELDFDSSS